MGRQGEAAKLLTENVKIFHENKPSTTTKLDVLAAFPSVALGKRKLFPCHLHPRRSCCGDRAAWHLCRSHRGSHRDHQGWDTAPKTPSGWEHRARPPAAPSRCPILDTGRRRRWRPPSQPVLRRREWQRWGCLSSERPRRGPLSFPAKAGRSSPAARAWLRLAWQLGGGEPSTGRDGTGSARAHARGAAGGLPGLKEINK